MPVSWAPRQGSGQAAHLDARRLVRQAHRALCRVDVLPARPARTEHLHLHVFRAQLDLTGALLRGSGGGRGQCQPRRNSTSAEPYCAPGRACVWAGDEHACGRKREHKWSAGQPQLERALLDGR